MLNKQYKIQASYCLEKKRLLIEVYDKIGFEMNRYEFIAEDVICTDYWNSIFIGRKVYDINFFKYPNWRLCLYEVIDNAPQWNMPIKVKLRRVD